MSVEADAPPASNMPSLKRPHPDNEVTMDPSTPIDTRDTSPSPVSTALSSPADIATPRDTPMASTNETATTNSPSKASTQSTLTNFTQPSSAPKPTPQSSSAPPAKRRKLTPAEKAQAEADKARKAQDRAEATARKEAEKQAKEDAKRKKAEEKEAEKTAKEGEKQAKEEEKRKKAEEKEQEKLAKEQEKQAKEEEKRKKAEERESEKALKELKKQEKEREVKQREASQMRLSAFFSVPKASSPAALLSAGKLKASASPSKHHFMTKDKARERSMSLDPVDFEPSTPTKSKHVSDSDKQAKQAAGKVFLPFMLGQNMRLAPINAFLPADEELVRMNEEMDRFASQPQSAPSPSVEVSFAKLRVARGYQPPKVAQIVQKLYGSSRAPIDLTLEGAETPVDVLKTVPVKFFFYGEDVRPPYRGTWTRTVTSRTARTLALKPLTQALPEVVYDYDSEAEWDDADEGEDIDVEDNEEEEEDEEDMDGFIDDKEAPQYLARRGLPANEVEPICSGLQWEDASGKMRSADPSYPDADFKEFEVCFLLDPSPGTIDPYTTAYWDPEPKQVSSMLPLTSTMGPPRLPLSDRTNGQGTVQSTLVNGKVPKAAKVGPRLVPADVLQAFREAVDGSDLTKIALIEALKKQFPKLRKDQIVETLPLIAHRVGAKQADKKWQLLTDAKV